MSSIAGAYDTTRQYRSGSHARSEDTPWRPAPPAAEVARMMKAWDDRAAFVAHTLRPAASAVLGYSEYLLAMADLPRDQQAVLDMLRRQAQTILWSLSALSAAVPGAAPSSSDTASGSAAAEGLAQLA